MCFATSVLKGRRVVCAPPSLQLPPNPCLAFGCSVAARTLFETASSPTRCCSALPVCSGAAFLRLPTSFTRHLSLNIAHQHVDTGIVSQTKADFLGPYSPTNSHPVPLLPVSSKSSGKSIYALCLYCITSSFSGTCSSQLLAPVISAEIAHQDH